MVPETETMKTYLDEEAREEGHKQRDHRKMQDKITLICLTLEFRHIYFCCFESL